MQVNDAKETFVFVLEGDPIAQSAEVIAQMNVACGLRAAEDSFHLTGTEKQDRVRDRHHNAEYHTKYAREHGDD